MSVCWLKKLYICPRVAYRAVLFFFITLDTGPRRPLRLALRDPNVFEPEHEPALDTLDWGYIPL